VEYETLGTYNTGGASVWMPRCYRRCHVPVYEFSCKKCRKTFEVRRPISKAPQSATCPKCRTKSTERAWTSVFAVTSKKS
jgi:putative FmdB family regulatory protein